MSYTGPCCAAHADPSILTVSLRARTTSQFSLEGQSPDFGFRIKGFECGVQSLVRAQESFQNPSKEFRLGFIAELPSHRRWNQSTFPEPSSALSPPSLSAVTMFLTTRGFYSRVFIVGKFLKLLLHFFHMGQAFFGGSPNKNAFQEP